MTETHEHRGHDHPHGHGHAHDHDAHGGVGVAGGPERLIVEELDPAGKSLADALKVSFRVLGCIIVVLLAAYLASGIFTVKTDERAVITRLGRVHGQVLKAGLKFSWPFPIDRAVIVNVHEQEVTIKSFRYYVSPMSEDRDYTQVVPMSGSLRPGYDGALITADGGLMHVRWNCQYVIPGDDDQAVLDYVTRLGGLEPDRKKVLEPAQRAVIDAVDNASIRVAAKTDLEAIRRNDPLFTQDVLTQAQKLLDDLKSGIRIRSLQCVEHVPPLQVRDAFGAVTTAEQDRSRMESVAEKNAVATTFKAAGPNWQPLIQAITQYSHALRDKDDAAGDAAYKKIDTLLLEDATGGDARQIIENARSQARQTVARARALADRFRQLLPLYLANPALTIQWEWMQAKQDILSRLACIKQYAPMTGKGMNLYVNYDPGLIKRLKEAEAKQLETNLEKQKQDELKKH
jgi:regulator of protease activity HflC (stomatin/prohibitin superfamily)